MKDWLKSLFSENSTVSALRFMSVITCLTACYLAIKDDTAMGMVSVLLAAAYGGKVSQKAIETRSDGTTKVESKSAE